MEYDPEVIIKEMLEWSKREDALHFVGFCADRGYLPDLIWRYKKDFKDFEDAVTLVKMRIAARRESMVNQNELNYGAYSRYQSMYDPFLYEFEDKEKDKDAERKKGIIESEKMNLVTLAQMAREGKITNENDS